MNNETFLAGKAEGFTNYPPAVLRVVLRRCGVFNYTPLSSGLARLASAAPRSRGG